MPALQASFVADPQPRPTPGGSRYGELQLQAWMIGGLNGDAQCHRSLLRAIRPLLTAFFGRRLRDNSADVEDLVQEVLIAVHERRASYDRSRPFTPWLFAVARHKMIDYLRRYRRTDPIDGLDDILIIEGFQARSDARMDVEALLETLPEKQARAIRLTRLDEMSVAEAALTVGIGESDVKVSAHRGIRALAARVAGIGR
jgi:RNA polymerase sigma factor (sigma-70 family)